MNISGSAFRAAGFFRIKKLLRENRSSFSYTI